MTELQKITPILIEDLGRLHPTETSKQKSSFGLYKCRCGNEFKARTQSVKNGSIVSCGCYRKQKAKEAQTTHNMNKHILYPIWNAMIQRTSNINNRGYNNYGGRGIKVCNRWLDINNFIEDMFPTWKKGLSIDRIDNNGNYELANCRWATKEVQVRNTRIIKSNNTSGYRGVTKSGNKWKCSIRANGKQIYIATYTTALEAAKAYDSYVIKNKLEHTINNVLAH